MPFACLVGKNGETINTNYFYHKILHRFTYNIFWGNRWNLLFFLPPQKGNQQYMGSGWGSFTQNSTYFYVFFLMNINTLIVLKLCISYLLDLDFEYLKIYCVLLRNQIFFSKNEYVLKLWDYVWNSPTYLKMVTYKSNRVTYFSRTVPIRKLNTSIVLRILCLEEISI